MMSGPSPIFARIALLFFAAAPWAIAGSALAMAARLTAVWIRWRREISVIASSLVVCVVIARPASRGPDPMKIVRQGQGFDNQPWRAVSPLCKGADLSAR